MLKFSFKQDELSVQSIPISVLNTQTFSVLSEEEYDKEKIGIKVYYDGELILNEDSTVKALYNNSIIGEYSLYEINEEESYFSFIVDKYEQLVISSVSIEDNSSVVFSVDGMDRDDMEAFDMFVQFSTSETVLIEEPNEDYSVSSRDNESGTKVLSKAYEIKLKCNREDNNGIVWIYDNTMPIADIFMDRVFSNYVYRNLNSYENGTINKDALIKEAKECYFLLDSDPKVGTSYWEDNPNATFSTKEELSENFDYIYVRLKNDIETPYGEVITSYLYYGQIVPQNAVFSDLLCIKIPITDVCNSSSSILGYDYYVKVGSTGNADVLTAYKKSYILSVLDNVVFASDYYNAKIMIPVSQVFSTRTFRDDILSNYFIPEELEKQVNPFGEAEKIAYYPVIPYEYDEDNPSEVKTFKPVDTIKFNFHFRKRQSREKWIPQTDSLWNGMSDDYDIEDNFFVMSDISSQSDLLTYLNFSDNDVKYQKSRLKKSFIRISYYDSDNPVSQTLLNYSTSFLDSSYLYSKMVKNAKLEPYSYKGYNNGIGSTVYSEPSGNLIVGKNDDEIEALRLSSQIVIHDKYVAQNSSEGFYMYLWDDEDKGVVPETVYMKVEFNHAAYGLTIPFMLPYRCKEFDSDFDITKDNIKTFEDIAYDWEGNGYSIIRYNKYAVIKLKYQYSKQLEKHVYYIDPSEYGHIQYDVTKNELVFNLYEAKVAF